MEPNSTPPATPADATQASADQRDLQDKLERQDEDPDAPAGWQTRSQIPDEN